MSEIYNELCNMLIRPMRQSYHVYDLGNPLLKNGKRNDFQILSQRNNKLKCSYYKCTKGNNKCLLPTIVYLHSLNGSRLEFLPFVDQLLQLGFNLCTLDLTACGMSQGDYVTLGALEKYDVLYLVKYLVREKDMTEFIVWGRSMGAVTAVKFHTLFYQQKRNSFELRNVRLLVLVLDSPFISLNRLAIQIAKNKVNIPEIVLKMAFLIVQNTIQSKAKFKTSELQLISELPLIHIPTLIITSKNDTLVSYEHSLSIYNKIGSNKKQLMYIQAQHNSYRQQKDLQKIFNFLLQYSNKQIFQKSSNNISIDTRSRSLRRFQDSQTSKEKLNRYQSSKNQIHIGKKGFFLSNVHQTQQNPIINFSNKNIKIRDFSQNKIICQENKEVYSAKKKHQNVQNRKFHSVERQKAMYSNLNVPQQRNTHNFRSQKFMSDRKEPISTLYSIPQNYSFQNKMKNKPSYKNIQCLKTVKKIKRLEPSIHKDENDDYQQKEDFSKNHLNVISAKLKKKAKNGIKHSFLSRDDRKTQAQVDKKVQEKPFYQQVTKSTTNLHFSTLSITNQSPLTFFSTKKIPSQSIIKPMTSQVPLYSSKKVNEIYHRRKQSMNQNYIIGNFQINDYKEIQRNDRGFSVEDRLYGNPEFMKSKKVVQSQVMSMRTSTRFDQSKKYMIARRQQHQLHQNQVDTSLSIIKN